MQQRNCANPLNQCAGLTLLTSVCVVEGAVHLACEQMVYMFGCETSRQISFLGKMYFCPARRQFPDSRTRNRPSHEDPKRPFLVSHAQGRKHFDLRWAHGEAVSLPARKDYHGGCDDGAIFFTKNGRFLEIAFRHVDVKVCTRVHAGGVSFSLSTRCPQPHDAYLTCFTTLAPGASSVRFRLPRPDESRDRSTR